MVILNDIETSFLPYLNDVDLEKLQFKEQNYYVPVLEDFKVDESLLNSFDIENISVETVLFQTGYLTIKQTLSDDNFLSYNLGFPNKEVRSAFNNYLSNIFINKAKKKQSPCPMGKCSIYDIQS